MDEELDKMMTDLLETWGVSQETQNIFRENHIDLSCLDGLEEDELKILIPEHRIKDRIKFKMGYKTYRKDIATVESNTDESLDSLSLSCCDVTDKHHITSEFNLQEVLKGSMQGRQALEAIKKKKLDSTARCHLVEAIVEYYIKRYSKMTKFDFEIIAAKIVRLCPNECKETYYVPSRTLGTKHGQKKAQCMPAKGKLVDRYYNQLRNLRGSGVLPKRLKVSRSSDNETDNESAGNDTDDDEQMKWLKYNRDPWPLVEEKWKASCAYRKKKTYNSDIKLCIMINDWPCLKSTNGHRLIEIDFCHLYEDKTGKLFEKWDEFQKTAIKLMETDPAIEENYKFQFKVNNEDVRDLAVCSSLACKIKPTSKLLNDKNKFNKVSIAESRQAFLTIVKNYADIEEELQNRHKSYNKKGLTCQPMIIGVGTLTEVEEFYVVVDDIKYRFTGLIKAINICFKSFMVLNLAYPKECEQLWLFIQQYFYEIYLSTDKKFSHISNFIKQLQELINCFKNYFTKTMWRCSICLSNFGAIKGLVLHMKVIHSLAADSTYRCNQNNCNRVYNNVKSFQKHLSTHSSEPDDIVSTIRY